MKKLLFPFLAAVALFASRGATGVVESPPGTAVTPFAGGHPVSREVFAEFESPVRATMPPLKSSSNAYWNALAKSGRGLSRQFFFPEGIPTNDPFSSWLLSSTNALERREAVVAVLTTDRSYRRRVQW